MKRLDLAVYKNIGRIHFYFLNTKDQLKIQKAKLIYSGIISRANQRFEIPHGEWLNLQPGDRIGLKINEKAHYLYLYVTDWDKTRII